MAEESKQIWEGKTSAELTGTNADQIWPLLEDFCNIHRWLPIDTSYQVEGVGGGMIRYCAATIRDDADPHKVSTMWAKEKLLDLDPIQRTVTYEVIDSNMGFKSYVGTMKVLPIISNNEKGPAVCKIEWSFICDPIEGWTFQGFLSYIQSYLQFMANKMEQTFSA
ncbi:START-like domain superfamily [Sesbania bispinosa]|nr:START-like domain superfamily [Sesbania bispinosa]